MNAERRRTSAGNSHWMQTIVFKNKFSIGRTLQSVQSLRRFREARRDAFQKGAFTSRLVNCVWWVVIFSSWFAWGTIASFFYLENQWNWQKVNWKIKGSISIQLPGPEADSQNFRAFTAFTNSLKSQVEWALPTLRRQFLLLEQKGNSLLDKRF